ncbi:hypothetical protein F5887DRAFT_94759 [Amanita rubescens]|nr:hypothetical protein F5887DRAFT_94759 [Amanita rubescens]
MIDDPNIAIASYLTPRGTRKLLTTSKFLKKCNEIWRAHNRQRYTGHCFRISGTTHYLLQAINPDVVRIMGCWSSDAFIRYWRQLDVVHTNTNNGRAPTPLGDWRITSSKRWIACLTLAKSAKV